MAKQNGEKLLTKKEIEICQKITNAADKLASKRARALLALNEGVTRAIAAEQSGLTLGQVRYLLTAFNEKHLAIFPEDTSKPTHTIEKKIKASKDKKKTKKKDKKDKKKKKIKKDKKKKSKKKK